MFHSHTHSLTHTHTHTHMHIFRLWVLKEGTRVLLENVDAIFGADICILYAPLTQHWSLPEQESNFMNNLRSNKKLCWLLQLLLQTWACFGGIVVIIIISSSRGESNGKLPLRTCPGCSISEPYQSPDWALVPAKPAQGLNTSNNNKVVVVLF
jgi:hypothetical protein